MFVVRLNKLDRFLNNKDQLCKKKKYYYTNKISDTRKKY